MLMAKLKRLFSRIADAIGASRDRLDLDDGYVIRIALPGVRERDVDVRADGDVVVISGVRARDDSSFTRSIALPRGVDTSKIEARFRRGGLELHVPDRQHGRVRQILIRRANGAAPTGDPIVRPKRRGIESALSSRSATN
jgi:HSP20 family molecular chaperone IbpA